MISDLYDIQYEKFKQEVKLLINVDLNQYKPSQMKRRIKSFISKHHCKSLDAFTKLLHQNKEVLQSFQDFMTINVTEFFRNSERFKELIEKVIPDIIRNAKSHGRDTIKMWSAGCSIGAEAYTLAIIMNEYFPYKNYSILATDIDYTTLNKAKLGEFKEIEIKNIDQALLKKYFDENVEEKKWRIKDRVKQNIRFMPNNLLSDSFVNGFDLILCRNVVIYFTEEAKDKLYGKFYNALYEGGVLFIGGTESILNARQIGFSKNDSLFYYK